MNRVKGNTGALLLFIGTIIIIITTVLGIILTALAIPAAGELAAVTVREAGGDVESQEIARNVTFYTAIVMIVISTLIQLLVIIPGFKYSLQGKAKTWAFVMAIIGIVSVVLDIINSLGSIGAILSTLAGAVGMVLYIIGVFMLRKKEA